jgi:hypothetical protein
MRSPCHCEEAQPTKQSRQDARRVPRNDIHQGDAHVNPADMPFDADGFFALLAERFNQLP